MQDLDELNFEVTDNELNEDEKKGDGKGESDGKEVVTEAQELRDEEPVEYEYANRFYLTHQLPTYQ